MAESENPLEEVTPPVVERVLEHTAQAGALTTEGLEAALTLHREKLIADLKAALREAIAENAHETVNLIKTELEEAERMTEEVPQVVGVSDSEHGHSPVTTLETETHQEPTIVVRRRRGLIPHR